MAKQQEWWLARDSLSASGEYILSLYPLHDCSGSIDPGRNWTTESPHSGKYATINRNIFGLLTRGKYKLEPGAEPRKVTFTPLGVKDVK